MMFRRLSAIALASLTLSPHSRAEKELPAPSFTPGSGIEMRVTNYYESIPKGGFLPLRLDVKNDSGNTGQWEIRTINNARGSRTFQSSVKIEVTANSARSFDILAPLAPAGGTYFYSNISIVIKGTAVVWGNTQDNSSSGSASTPFLGMGEELASRHWSVIRSNIEKSRSLSLDGTPLDLAFMPADWRALAGFDFIILTDNEWRSLPPAARTCLLDWNARGGSLILHGNANTSGLPKEGSRGIGEMKYWPSDSDIPAEVEKLLTSRPKSSISATQDDYLWSWNIAERVGRASPPQLLILGFVLIFAAVVGPVNFLVFAPSGRRHRLFWTTPLISLGATGLMLLFIVLSEGFGGRGERLVALLSLPDEHKSILWQEQVSRTGALIAGSFELPAGTLPVPIDLRKNNEGSVSDFFNVGSFSLHGNTWSGDWFKSRTTQAQLLTQITSSRNRLEVATDSAGVPTATSSFDQELGPIWYFDSSGQVWRGERIAPGQSLTFSLANPGDFDTWFKEAEVPAGPVIRNSLKQFRKSSGAHFFATIRNPPAIGSLPAINWKNNRGVVMGRIVSR